MNVTTFDWDLIGEIAAALGVQPRTLEKWRERGSVPHKWRLPIIRASSGRVPLDAFDVRKNGAVT